MEAVLTRKVQLPSPEPEEIDYRSLPQTTVRKVIKQCLENGTFDTTPFIDSRPLIDYVPKEVISQHKPATKKGRKGTPQPRGRTRRRSYSNWLESYITTRSLMSCTNTSEPAT